MKKKEGVEEKIDALYKKYGVSEKVEDRFGLFLERAEVKDMVEYGKLSMKAVKKLFNLRFEERTEVGRWYDYFFPVTSEETYKCFSKAKHYQGLSELGHIIEELEIEDKKYRTHNKHTFLNASQLYKEAGDIENYIRTGYIPGLKRKQKQLEKLLISITRHPKEWLNHFLADYEAELSMCVTNRWPQKYDSIRDEWECDFDHDREIFDDAMFIGRKLYGIAETAIETAYEVLKGNQSDIRKHIGKICEKEVIQSKEDIAELKGKYYQELKKNPDSDRIDIIEKIEHAMFIQKEIEKDTRMKKIVFHAKEIQKESQRRYMKQES